jgi:hypothetical protein
VEKDPLARLVCQAAVFTARVTARFVDPEEGLPQTFKRIDIDFFVFQDGPPS